MSPTPVCCLFGLVVAMLLAICAGCNSPSVRSGIEGDYGIEGVIVVDPNLDSDLASKSVKIAVRFKRDGEPVDTGQVTVAGQSLVFQSCQCCLDSLYWLAADSAYGYANSSRLVQLREGSDFSDTIVANIPDSFSISNVVPTNRLIQGNGQASLEWTGSTGAERYVLAAVLADSAYTGYGFSSYADAGVTSGTIPPDAFTLANGVDPAVGLYVLYVYSITGSPDMALANAFLPVPLPSQLPDNVSHVSLSGRFGTVMVTPYDTIRVVEQS